MRSLVRRYDDLQGMYYQEQNRLEAANATATESIKEVLEILQSELKSIELQMNNHIQIDSDLRQQYTLLKSVPGIGDKTIAKILAFCANVINFLMPSRWQLMLDLIPSIKNLVNLLEENRCYLKWETLILGKRFICQF